MDWSVRIDQQRNTLLLTFYMFIAMTLVVIRAGLTARCAPDSFPLTSPQGDGSQSFPAVSPHGGWPLSSRHPPSLDDYLDQLYAEALALLYAAELVARRLAGLQREIYELMNQTHAMAQSLRDKSRRTAQLPERAVDYFDTS